MLFLSSPPDMRRAVVGRTSWLQETGPDRQSEQEESLS